jgi:hypothetical protein
MEGSPQAVAPPSDPELRKRIEKLAQYVVKSGVGFEQKVREKEKDNPQWAFLRNKDNAAAAYYRWMIHMKRMQQPSPVPTAPELTAEDAEKRAYKASLKQQREAKRKQQSAEKQSAKKQSAEKPQPKNERPRKRRRVEVEQYYVHVCARGERVIVQDLCDGETDPDRRKHTAVEHDLDDRNWPGY